MLNLNSHLLKSINTNKLIINISNKDYLKINKIVLNLKNKYKKELTYYQTIKNQNIDIIKKHSDLIKKIIYDVIKEFEIINKYDICIFLTGSFARCTNKKNSDIDLQFVYNQKYKNKIFKYEEMIYYIIGEILELNRSSIHSMLVSRLSKENIDSIESKIDKQELIVILHNNIEDICYKYSSNTKRRIYLQYGNNNTIEEVFKYLKYEVENDNKEWAHTFYVFTQKKLFDKYYANLYQQELKLINKERIINRIIKIQNKIKEINQDLQEIDKFDISQIKLIYQYKEFALLNEYISLIRDQKLLSNQEWKYINYYENQNYLTEDPLYEQIICYIFNIFKIAEPLKKAYSLHTNKHIRLNNYDELEKILKHTNDKILNIIKKKADELNG